MCREGMRREEVIQVENEKVHATIRSRNLEGEITDTLKMTQEEYDDIIAKFSTSHRTFLRNIPLSEHIRDDNVVIPSENKLINFGSVDSEGFVKAFYLINSLSKRIIDAMKEHKSFQFVIVYEEEALKTDLAEKAGVTERAVYYWERGEKNMSIESADKVFKALEVSITIGSKEVHR